MLAIAGVAAQLAPLQVAPQQAAAPADTAVPTPPPPSVPPPGVEQPAVGPAPAPAPPAPPQGPAPAPALAPMPAPAQPVPPGAAAPPPPLAPGPVNSLDAPSADAPPPDPPPNLCDEKKLPLRWPYLDLEYGGLDLDNRYTGYGVLWVHLGAYPWERLHVTARIGFAQSDASANEEQESLPPGFSRDISEGGTLPSVYGNLGLGYVFTSGGAFIFAPSATLHLSDNSDYGYGAGILVPFVWVTRGGFRIGFEASVMRVFGGSVRYTCTAMGAGAPCETGEVREFDRSPGAGFSAGFLVGYGLE